jgi:collagenase-like PrtC family protease
MNLYKVGCNFDFKLIDEVVRLNKKYEGRGKVVEFFGSYAANAEVTARPKWRLQDITDEYFERFVKKAKENGIVFNYTMNSIQPYGSKKEMMNHKKEIQEFALWLEKIGVYRITIANPMMAMFIREVSNIELEISCITHVDTVTQFKYYHETFGINKFCNSILKNRNKEFLQRAAKYCNENGIILELLANEFCGVAGVDKNNNEYATHCAYRDSCYLCHATNVTKEDTMSYDNYPMNFCMCARNSTPQAWLRMRWIRPEDQHYYNEIGINYFKISGRTGTTEYLSEMMEAYLSESFDDNVLRLWKPLETIYNGQKESEHNHTVNIPNKKLDGFLDKWFKGDGWECENHMCGEDCKYCEEFMKKISE